MDDFSQQQLPWQTPAGTGMDAGTQLPWQTSGFQSGMPPSGYSGLFGGGQQGGPPVHANGQNQQQMMGQLAMANQLMNTGKSQNPWASLLGMGMGALGHMYGGGAGAGAGADSSLVLPAFAAGGGRTAALPTQNSQPPSLGPLQKQGAVQGPGDGRSDQVPAVLSRGEYVAPADVVGALGRGSNDAGADKMDSWVQNVRTQQKSKKLPAPKK